MARGYDKEFLIAAYLHRFIKHIPIETLCALEDNANTLYDKVGKDKFRDYASLDAQAIKEYKANV